MVGIVSPILFGLCLIGFLFCWGGGLCSFIFATSTRPPGMSIFHQGMWVKLPPEGELWRNLGILLWAMGIIFGLLTGLAGMA